MLRGAEVEEVVVPIGDAGLMSDPHKKFRHLHQLEEQDSYNSSGAQYVIDVEAHT